MPGGRHKRMRPKGFLRAQIFDGQGMSQGGHSCQLVADNALGFLTALDHVEISTCQRKPQIKHCELYARAAPRAIGVEI